MRVSGVLLRPVRIARRRMALILGHVVVLRCIGRVGRVGRTRGGYRRIYGDVRVRLDVRGVVMVILMPIWQGHGRTCCLCHTSCVGVSRMRSVLLARQVIRRQAGRTRRGRSHPEFRGGCRSGRKIGGSHFLRRRKLGSRRRICGRWFRIATRRQRRKVDECANLTAGMGRVHLCPSIAATARSWSARCLLVCFVFLRWGLSRVCRRTGTRGILTGSPPGSAFRPWSQEALVRNGRCNDEKVKSLTGQH